VANHPSFAPVGLRPRNGQTANNKLNIQYLPLGQHSKRIEKMSPVGLACVSLAMTPILRLCGMPDPLYESMVWTKPFPRGKRFCPSWKKFVRGGKSLICDGNSPVRDVKDYVCYRNSLIRHGKGLIRGSKGFVRDGKKNFRDGKRFGSDGIGFVCGSICLFFTGFSATWDRKAAFHTRAEFVAPHGGISPLRPVFLGAEFSFSDRWGRRRG
jgi:hypothetical protein